MYLPPRRPPSLRKAHLLDKESAGADWGINTCFPRRDYVQPALTALPSSIDLFTTLPQAPTPHSVETGITSCGCTVIARLAYSPLSSIRLMRGYYASSRPLDKKKKWQSAWKKKPPNRDPWKQDSHALREQARTLCGDNLHKVCEDRPHRLCRSNLHRLCRNPNRNDEGPPTRSQQNILISFCLSYTCTLPVTLQLAPTSSAQRAQNPAPTPSTFLPPPIPPACSPLARLLAHWRQSAARCSAVALTFLPRLGALRLRLMHVWFWVLGLGLEA